MTETKSKEKITVIDLPVTALRSFEIDKARFSIRLTEPYTEERKAMARAKMNEINNKEDIG